MASMVLLAIYHVDENSFMHTQWSQKCKHFVHDSGVGFYEVIDFEFGLE